MAKASGDAATATKERILRAAVAEFGAHGYSGARTAAIAARAGVNAQLITYHFGGKQGLLDALRAQWAEKQAGLIGPDATFAESFAAYVNATLEQPEWSRMVVWQALGDAGSGVTDGAARPDQLGRMSAGLERVAERQRSGEISSDVDTRFVMLLTYALAFAPITMPQFVSAIFGDDQGHAEYRRLVVEQLTHLLEAKS
jgi:AcrR family transcriptional regulator